MLQTNSTIIVTGGAGFIGSAFVRMLIKHTDYKVINVDKLTYAGNLSVLLEIKDNPRHIFVQADIADEAKILEIFNTYKPHALVNFAAESHVDRSIASSHVFMNTNILGTYTLLEVTRKYYATNAQFHRFIHISTDEVFGALGKNGSFNENSPYDPRSPYSASKASSDMLAFAWHHTYGLPVIVTNCTNNYGPYHFPEKLIPLIINNAIRNKPITIYGDGGNIRDWLYVDDHVSALLAIMQYGLHGNRYCIGGAQEKTNLEVALTICDILNQKHSIGIDYRDLIVHVTDRLGHDYRYSIDATKLKSELRWSPQETFVSGINKTIDWYLANQDYVEQCYKRAHDA